jgi:hypothetical protein
MNPTFKVQDSDRHKSIADGDVSATATSQRADGTANTRTNTESDKVTGVMRGDSIDYKIDITTALERQMLCYLYTSLAINDVVEEGETIDQLKQMGVAFPQPYFNRWCQPALAYLVDQNGNILNDDGEIIAWKVGEESYVDEQGNPVEPYRLVYGIKNLTKPELHVSFTLPDSKDSTGAYNLQYVKKNLDKITVSNSRSDGIQWKLAQNSLAFDESTRTISFDVYISPKDIGQTVSMYEEEIRNRYKNIGSGPGYLNEDAPQIIQDTLEKMDGNNVTVAIPGVKVSNDADAGEAFTAKAKVAGDMFYGTSPYEGIMGTSAPLGSPRPPRKGLSKLTTSAMNKAQKKAAEAMADEMDNVEDQSAISTLGTTSSSVAAASTADDSSTTDEYELWTPDQYVDFHDAVNLYDYDNYEFVFGNYYWKHLQNDEGKDCIQEEANSEEMWYTVMIPSATISKTVKASNDADKDGSFEFQIKLDNPSEAPVCNSVKHNAVKHLGNSSQAVTLTFDQNGTATFKLKNGERMEIVLPFDVKYTVTELSGEDFDTKMECDGQTIKGKSLTDTIDSVTDSAGLATYQGHTANCVSVTNSKQEELVPGKDKGSFTVSKKWKDGNNKDGLRPDSVKVQLTANGQDHGDPVTLSADNDWAYTWDNLAITDSKTGENIKYRVKEIDVPQGYHAKVSYKGNSAAITNIYGQDDATPSNTTSSNTPSSDSDSGTIGMTLVPLMGDFPVWLLVVLIALVAVGGAALVISRKHRKSK